MRNHQMLKPTLPTDKRTSPRPQISSAYSKRSPRVPKIPSSPSALEDQVTGTNDQLVLSPLQSNRRPGRSARGQPTIFKPKFDSNSPMSSRNQKRVKDKAPARTPRCESITDIKENPKCEKYVADIERIEKLKNRLVTRHPENENYYQKHYSSFLRILNEALASNPAKVSIVVQNTKMFFEGLIQNLIGKRGKLDKANFDFEGTLRSIISNPDSSTNDQNGADKGEKAFQELFSKSGKLLERRNNNEIDLSKLKQYDNEIQEIKGLMQKLVDRHPENERYYTKHYESFLRILSEAVSENSKKAPIVIRNTKTFFEGLLNGLIGKNGRLKTSSFNFEEKLRKVISKQKDDDDDDDDSNDDIIQDLINDANNNNDDDDDDDDDEVNDNAVDDQSNLDKFMSEIKVINDLVQQLIDKHPENEDYYRDHYDSFMKVLDESFKANSEKAPSIIQNAKRFFEGLLNDQIGENGKVDDSEFNFEERLRTILSQEEEDSNENVFEDLLNKDDKSKLQKYESEIKEINDLIQQLIDKHPENEDYYRDHYDSFMKVLKESIATNSEKAPSIIQNAKKFFEGLLNDQIGENGKVDDSEFNFEERLRTILTQEEDSNENVFEDLFNKEEKPDLQQYESEIKEINDLIQQLIDKHPENEDYYRTLYDSFMKVLEESITTDNEKAPSIIQNAKKFFEGLLNDQIGENGKVDDSEFNFEERLRTILTQEEEDSNENVFEDLINKKNKSKLQQYESEIKEIDDLIQQLIDKHPENEDYYRKLYDSFMKVLEESITTDNEKAPSIIQNAKKFFEGLLNDQIGENGKVDDSEFNFEERLRTILTQEEEDSNENVFEDLFNKEEKPDLQQYESEIKEINDLIQQLIDKHPENEDYYRKLYDSFMKVLEESITTDNEKAPSIIQNAKRFFEGLLNDQIGENGKVDDSEFNFEERLRTILSQEEEDSNENVFEDLLNKEDQKGLQQYESEIKEINDLVQQLIDKHPENEDYYRELYDSFMKVLGDAIKTNNAKAPIVIKNTKMFFEDLLNGQIGENGKVDDSDFNFEERLRTILTQEDDDDEENVFEDLINKEDESDLQQYESEIKEIKDLMQQLIDKHPENEEYYRDLYDSFLRVLSEAVEENEEKAPLIIKNTKMFFEDLLNGQIGENGKVDDSDFNFEDRLRTILTQEGEYDDEDLFEDLLNKEDESDLQQYESEIKEIKDLMQQLIDKHPENEEYYRDLYDSFLRVLSEAVEENEEKAPAIIKNTKMFFEGLLNDEIGENGKVDDSKINFEDRLRTILTQEEENSNENVFEDLLNKEDQKGIQKYESEIKEINDLVQQLIDKHPENEDYYRMRYDAFMRLLDIAAKESDENAQEIIKETKDLFQKLLNDEESDILSKTGKSTKEGLEEADLNFTSSGLYKIPALAEDPEYDDEESKSKSKSILEDDQGGTKDDQSVLNKYESEIGEIENLVQDLIGKHPESEDYYRKLYDAFMKVVKEAAETDDPATPEIIKATKTILEDLLNGEQTQLDYDLEDKLRELLTKSNENTKENENSEENDQTNLSEYKSEIGEIENLVQDLIDKHPENEDYYRKLYDAFMKVIKEAAETDSLATPEIIKATKSIFEDLLKSEQTQLDYDLEDKLREFLTKSNENENDQSNLNKYESEIGEIQNIMNDLIDKHPENEDYYRKLYESFMKVIKEAAETGSPVAPKIIEATKSIFEDLLNEKQDKLDFDIEDKLREILSESNENESEIKNGNENEKEAEDQSDTNRNETEMDEIQTLLQKLIDKHPENEDFYRKLYDSFITVIQQASEAKSPQVPGIIRATKLFFEELLNGEHAKIDFNIGEKLREILLSVNNVPLNGDANENENENENESEDKHDDNNNNNNNNNGENSEENEQTDLSEYKSEICEIKDLMQNLIDKHPENEDYYRKLYDAFMKVVKEAAETDSLATPEIIKATKTILEDLLKSEQTQLDYDLEDKLRELYKPYNEIANDDDDYEMSQSSASKSPKFEKLYPPPLTTPNANKRSSTVPNYQTIICALRFSCLPGPRFTKLVESLSTTMKENKDERFVLLFASRTQKFKGIYILSDDALSAKKMWGEGPNEIKSEDCGAFSKYITNQKIFEPLQIRGFTQTTDAFSLKKKVEPDLW